MTTFEKAASKVPAATGDISATTKQSLDVASATFSGWLRDANRFQAEAIRFLNDRLDKDIRVMSRYAACKKPEDILELQAKLVTDMVSDYMTEGAKVLALFGDAVKGEVDVLSRTLKPK